MPSRLRGPDGRFRAEDEADLVVPLRFVVGGTLLYALYLALRASTPFPSDTYPVSAAAHLPKGS